MKPVLFSPDGVLLEGMHLIEASAGTGKTHNITFMVVRLIVEKRLPIERILTVTFTEAATEELKGKIRERLCVSLAALEGRPCDDEMIMKWAASRGDRQSDAERISAAIRDFDQAAIFTIHGFCNRVLKVYAFEAGVLLDAELSTDDSEFIRELGEDFWANISYDADPMWVRLITRMGYSPEYFSGFARKLLGHPDIELVSEPPMQGRDKLREAVKLARSAWRDGAQNIPALMASHPGVNRRSYSKRNVPNWLQALGEWLTPESPTVPPGFDGPGSVFPAKDGIQRFASSTLAAVCPAGATPPTHPVFDACEALIAASKALHFDACGLKVEFRNWLRTVVPERKRKRGILFFDDLIQHLDLALADASAGPLLEQAVRRAFGAALIDEFQDTDRVQYDIFARLFKNTGIPFFMIGDPKQSIYAFRGGDVFAYLQAARDVRNAHTLGVNWRSDPALIRAVNRLFQRHPAPFINGDIAFHPVQARPDAKDTWRVNGEIALSFEILLMARDEDNTTNAGHLRAGDPELPARVAADIAALLNAETAFSDPPRRLTPADIAVLVPTNNLGRSMCQALRECGVPAVNAAQGSVFQSEAALDFYQVLLAVASPLRSTAVRSALCTRIFGVTATELDVLRHDDDEWSLRVAIFENLRLTWLHAGFVQMTRELMQRSDDFMARILRFSGGERYLTDLIHLIELARVECFRQGLGIHTLIRFFEGAMVDEVASAGDGTIRLETEAAAVQVVTIHKSKGLQYPVVYLPFLWRSTSDASRDGNPVFHDVLDGFRMKMDVGSADAERAFAAAQREQQEEEVRLLYVALTRARYHCRVVWGGFDGAADSALGRLFHVEPVPEASGKELEKTRLSDDEILRDLQMFASETDGAAEVSMLMDEPCRFVPGTPTETERLACRVFRGTISESAQLSSFSRLTAVAQGDTPGQDETHITASRADTSTQPIEQPSILGDFPRGIPAGICLHAIMENIDFVSGASAERQQVVARILQQRGFSGENRSDRVAAAVERVLDTPLLRDLHSFRLKDIHRTARISELEFLMPVEKGSRLSPRTLSAALLIGAQGEYRNWAQSVSAMRFSAMHGFMTGVMDLVICHEGKWYIADYKSNDLGPATSDYGAQTLAASMAQHHYYLQYHLYAVALDRMLSFRQPHYRYETDFGGVLYLYLRGMGHGPGSGVFFDRPPRERIEAISALIRSAMNREEERTP